MTRSKTLFILAPIAIIVLLFLLLPLLLDKEKILDLATAAVKEQTGATLTVDGPVELALFPRIGISLADVSLVMAEDTQPLLQVRSLDIGLQLLPLLTGRAEVEVLSLDGLTSRIAASDEKDTIDTGQMSNRELDEFYARRREEQAAAATAAESGNAPAIPLALNVKALRVTDSKLELLDADGTAPTVVNIERFEVDDLNLETRPITLRGTIRLVADKAITLTLNGTVRVDEQRQVAILDTLELGAAGVTAAPVQLQLEGEVDINRMVADLQLGVQLAETHGEGSLRYAAFESPGIDAIMNFNLFDPALLALAGPGAGAGADAEPGSDGGDTSLPLETLRNIDTRVALTVDKAIFGDHQIDNLAAKVRAVDGVVKLKSVTGKIHGGELVLKGTLNGKHNTAVLKTDGSLVGLDLASLLAASQMDPVATGKANLDWKLSAKGRTPDALQAALNGPITLATEQVVLQGAGVEGMLCRAVALINQEALSTTFPTSTSFKTLTADIQLANGKAVLKPLRADLPQITLRGNGSYELLSKNFETTFKARLSPELETLDRACRVSKRLTAIDWPVNCAGNIADKPASWCSVDTREIIEDLGKNEVQRQIQKGAGKLLDKLFN